MAESLLATLRVELVHDATWATRAAAQADLFEYLEAFYNGQRRLQRSAISARAPSSGN